MDYYQTTGLFPMQMSNHKRPIETEQEQEERQSKVRFHLSATAASLTSIPKISRNKSLDRTEAALTSIVKSPQTDAELMVKMLADMKKDSDARFTTAAEMRWQDSDKKLGILYKTVTERNQPLVEGSMVELWETCWKGEKFAAVKKRFGQYEGNFYHLPENMPFLNGTELLVRKEYERMADIIFDSPKPFKQWAVIICGHPGMGQWFNSFQVLQLISNSIREISVSPLSSNSYTGQEARCSALSSGTFISPLQQGRRLRT